MADDDEVTVDLTDPELPLDEPPEGGGKGDAPAPAGQAAAAPESTQPPAPPAPPAPAAGLEELERAVSRERAERERIQAERDHFAQVAAEAERRGVSTHELLVDNQIKATIEQLDALQRQQEGAYENGDWKLVAQINRKMHDLSGQLALDRRDKAYIEQVSKQPRPVPGPQPAAASPVERALSAFSPPAQAFLRKHPDLMRGDGTLKRSAVDAHEKALDEGFAADSEGYFAHIEKVLGKGAVVSSPPAAPAPPSAPPSPSPALGAPTMAAP